MKTIGLLGLGPLGSAITERLLNAGYDLGVWDRDRKARDIFKGRVAIASNLRDLVQRSDYMLMALPDPSSVADACFSAQGVYDGLRPSKIVASVTTIEPVTSRNIARRFQRKRAFFLETPVIGGAELAGRGELVTLVGGDRRAYQEMLGVLKSYSRSVFYIGGNGAALAVKLALSHLAASYAETLAEAILLVEKSDVDPSVLLQILGSSEQVLLLSMKKRREIAERNYERVQKLSDMLEDIRLAHTMAREKDIVAPILSLMEELYTVGLLSGLGDEDYTAIAEVARKLNRKG